VDSGRKSDCIADNLVSAPRDYYRNLGAEHFDCHVTPEHKKRTHLGQLEALGYRVTLEPAA
jgi:transposase